MAKQIFIIVSLQMQEENILVTPRTSTIQNHTQFLEAFPNSCYTTCRSQNGKILRLSQHINRLYTACKKNAKQNDDKSIYNSILSILISIQRNLQQDKIQRIFIVINYQTLQPHIFIEDLPQIKYKTTNFLTRQIVRPDPNIKDDVWVEKRKECMKLINNQINEVLIYNYDGIVTEGLSMYTPSTKLCLDGTIREVVIKVCQENDIQFQENDNIQLQDIYQADEVFVCSTSRTIIFAKQVDDKQLQNRDINNEQKLFNLVAQEIQKQCEDIQQQIDKIVSQQ